MNEFSGAHVWAHKEFGEASLGDKRRTPRLVNIAGQLAASPGGRITTVFQVPADRTATYRFLENQAIAPTAIAEASHEAAAHRCWGMPFVFAPTDQTDVCLTDCQGVKGLGGVGTHGTKARGLQVVSTIVVSPDGTPLGLSGMAIWPRHVGKKKSAHARRRQRTEDKETQQWLDSMRQSIVAMEQAGVGTRLWFQLDRGGDGWPIFREPLGDAYLTVRSSWDRRLVTPSGPGQRYLREFVRSQEPAGDYLLDVPAGKNRTGRVATMRVRACAVTLDLWDRRTNQHHPTTLWAVSTEEISAVPRGEEPIAWLLLTTYPVHSIDDAYQVVFGYAQRWKIETFHNSWKTGACNVEQTQLRELDHILRWLMITAAVAMRIQRLTHLARNEPDLPATVELTQAEIDAAIVVTKQKTHRRGDVPTIAQAVLWIAQAGGYTGKSSGGPPGARVIARGLDKIDALARYFSDEAGKK